MPHVNNDRKEIQLEGDSQDAVLIVSKDGEVIMIEPPYDGAQPGHVRMVEGMCKALTNTELFQEMVELAERAHMLADDIETFKPPTLN